MSEDKKLRTFDDLLKSSGLLPTNSRPTLFGLAAYRRNSKMKARPGGPAGPVGGG